MCPTIKILHKRGDWAPGFRRHGENVSDDRFADDEPSPCFERWDMVLLRHSCRIIVHRETDLVLG